MRSIRARLLVGLLLLVTVVSLIVGSITYRRVLGEASTLFDYQLRQMALSLGEQASYLSSPYALPSNPNSDFAIQIWDIFGKRIISSPGLPFLDTATLGYSDLTVQNERWRVYALETESSVIQVAQPWAVRERLAREAALRVIVPLLLLLPLMALAAAWIIARAMRPLKSITTQIEHRDIHSLSPVAAADLPAEVSPLVDELNRLLGRLAAAFASQRDFVADAAHELRSPLTALSLHLQLVDRARDDTERALATTRLRAAIDRATHLVSQLLTLARNEPQGVPVNAAPAALGGIVRDALGDVQPLAQQRRIRIELEESGEVTVRADAEALRILVRNLLDNAIRYSPEDSTVRVRAARHPGGAAMLEVADQGPGIAPSDHARAFARFYRAPDASEGGSGLGLAIVKAIAERHGAQVALAAVDPNGLRVVVTFPTAA
ncbi:MAG TPA: ATP-binding protein [Steroidobacteraceae bacterium]|jgi:two-component system OmpR family sensor kinase/two-component system sensor histidine kinase QseC|nr:ATP-binding protein [Steroidobacteraceae bacterium]